MHPGTRFYLEVVYLEGEGRRAGKGGREGKAGNKECPQGVPHLTCQGSSGRL